MVAIVVDPDGDLAGVREANEAVAAAGMMPVIVSASGGTVGADQLIVQRTFLTARSVEFDAFLVAGTPTPASGAMAGMDAKAGEATAGPIDPRVVLLLAEAFRHAKATGGWGDAEAVR